LHRRSDKPTEGLTSVYRGADKSLARPTFRCILFWFWEYFVWCWSCIYK